MTISKGLFIPWDDMKPIEIKDFNDEDQYGMVKAVFPHENGDDFIISTSSFRHAGAQLWYDDLGSYNQRAHINMRAMKLWGYLAGRHDFTQYLYGDFFAIGLDDVGETVDVPDRVKNFFAEENIHLLSGD
jgi:hypothetical protein